MNNSTNIRILKKYEKYITEVWYEGDDGYWADLIECCICDDTECHYVHEDTVKEFLKSLQNIRVLNEKEYIYYFGNDLIDDYKRDIELLN